MQACFGREATGDWLCVWRQTCDLAVRNEGHEVTVRNEGHEVNREKTDTMGYFRTFPVKVPHKY